MTLHNTAELMKKGGIASAIGIGVIIMLVIFFRIGVVVKNILYPPKIDPANQAYGKIPPLEFPESTVKGDFTYTIETLTGQLPDDFPDRLIVYPIINNEPNLSNLQTVKDKVTTMGFVDELTGEPIAEIPRGGPLYEWSEKGGFERKIIFDIVSFNFELSSQYITFNTVLKATFIKGEAQAITTAQNFLSGVNLLPKDIDADKTKNPDPEIKYTRKPQLYSINGGELVPASSLANTQVIRVDFYQKDIEYILTAGQQNSDLTRFQDFEMKLPIMYPQPPYSTMNFLIASGDGDAEVVSAVYNHQNINLEPADQEQPATYPIKTAEEAFEELKSGEAYIAAYGGGDDQILIDKVYLAYFAGKERQEYLMPIIVFEGQNGFFAYVSAVKEEALE